MRKGLRRREKIKGEIRKRLFMHRHAPHPPPLPPSNTQRPCAVLCCVPVRVACCVLSRQSTLLPAVGLFCHSRSRSGTARADAFKLIPFIPFILVVIIILVVVVAVVVCAVQCSSCCCCYRNSSGSLLLGCGGEGFT